MTRRRNSPSSATTASFPYPLMPFTLLSIDEQTDGRWALSWGALFAPAPSEKSSRRIPAPTFALVMSLFPRENPYDP